MNTEEQTALDAIKTAMRGYDWRLQAVLAFGPGVGVQVYAKAPGTKRYVKVGPILFPAEGQTIADVLTMLGSLAVEDE